MLLILLVATALALAFANGANDNFKAVATLYGSKTTGYVGARRLATAAQVAGSLASVLLARALLETFSGKGLVPAGVVGDVRFLASVGAGATVTVLLASRLGLPVSTTHALVGGLVGAGLVFAPDQLAWGGLMGSYFAPLLVSPLLALAAAGLLYPLLHRTRRALGVEREICLCIGPVPEPVDLSPSGLLLRREPRLPLTLDEQAACREMYGGRLLGLTVQGIVNGFHTASAAALGFARGLNDTPKVLALLVAAGWSGLEPRLAQSAVATCMALGGWLQARQVAETLAYRITSLTHGQGLLASSVASLLVIGASCAGAPVSTTHVSTGAIFGIGLWSRRTHWPTVAGIASAWLATLPCAALLAAAAASALL